MRVVMTVGIGGFRNGEPWPAAGDTIDLPDLEAADLIAAGYASPGEDQGPVFDPSTATKAGVLAWAEARGVALDRKAPVKTLRAKAAAIIAGRHTDPDEQAPASDAGEDQDPQSAGLDDMDKGQLLDVAAEHNISVNPALSEDEIRAVVAAALYED